MHSCPHCVNPTEGIIEDMQSGDRVCRDCGTVLASHIISDEQEWRSFTDDGVDTEMERTGTSVSFLKNDLSTLGGGMGGRKDAAAKKLHMKVTWNASDEKLRRRVSQVTDLCRVMSLPGRIEQTAIDIFVAAAEACSLPEPKVAAVVAASVYAACRQNGVSRSLREVAAVSPAPFRHIGKAFLSIKRVLELQLEAASFESFMPRFCSALKLPHSLGTEAAALAASVAEQAAAGRAPAITAAASLLAVCTSSPDPTMRRTIAEVAAAAKVSETTLRAALPSMTPPHEAPST